MAKKRRTLAGRIKDELDPEWKSWFEEVARRREQLTSAKYRPIATSRYVVDGVERIVTRQKSTPTPVKNVMKTALQKMHYNRQMDLALVRETWQRVVGNGVAEEADLYSFKNGILTIEVYSPTLLQELRMFQAKAILQDMRDIWPFDTPLVRVKFQPGKKK